MWRGALERGGRARTIVDAIVATCIKSEPFVPLLGELEMQPAGHGDGDGYIDCDGLTMTEMVTETVTETVTGTVTETVTVTATVRR